MKKLTTAALVAAMAIATTATAQQRAVPRSNGVKTPSQVVTPKAGQTTQTSTDALLGAAKALNGGTKLKASTSEGTCDTVNSLVKSTLSVLSGSQKMAFTNAISAINYNGQEVIQACKAKQPITDKVALQNLGKIVIEVGGKVQRNEAIATDIKAWGNALAKVLGVSEAEGLEKAKGLASGECGLLNVQI